MGLSVSGSFVCRCLTSSIMLRFHFPLIEPDMQISRSRALRHAVIWRKLSFGTQSFGTQSFGTQSAAGSRRRAVGSSNDC